MGMAELSDGVELGALCMGLFGIADFLMNINRHQEKPKSTTVRMRDMRPTGAEIKQAFFPMLRGTAVGTLFGAMPGTGPTITTFIAYAFERKIVEDARALRQGRDRRRRGAGGRVALEDAGRLHSRRCRSASRATR